MTQGSYQRAGQMVIRPLLFKENTFDLAKLFYAQYSDLDFASDVIDYLRTGFVVSRPSAFGMAKVVDYKGEKMWHIQIAIGNLLELVTCIPYRLERICFCRNNRPDKMVVVKYDTLLRRVAKRYGYKNV